MADENSASGLTAAKEGDMLDREPDVGPKNAIESFSSRRKECLRVYRHA